MRLAIPGMFSIHANNAREAITKMCTLPLLAGENVGHAFVVPTLAASIDLVVHMATGADGRRRVHENVAVPGRAEGGVIEAEDIFEPNRPRVGGDLGSASPEEVNSGAIGPQWREFNWDRSDLGEP
jgi:hypothetical protein